MAIEVWVVGGSHEGGCDPFGGRTGSSRGTFGGVGAGSRILGGVGAGPYGVVGRIWGGVGAGPNGKSREEDDDPGAKGCCGTYALSGSPPDRDILVLPATVVVPCRPVAFQEDSSTQAAAKAAAKDDMPSLLR